MKLTIEAQTDDPKDMEMLYRMFGVPTLQTVATAPFPEPVVADTAKELLNQEGDVIDGQTEVPTTEEKAKVTKKKTTKKKAAKKAAPKAAEEPDVMPAKKETSAAASVTVEDGEPAAEATGRPLTLKEVRDAFTKYVKDTSLETASALLDKFEIKRVSDLEESKYVEFFEAIRG